MEPPPPRPRSTLGPWIALAAVFVVPVLGAALGLPVGEWLSALTGERALPEFFLRGEKSHFSKKPREPKPESVPSSLDFVKGERGEPPAPPENPLVGSMGAGQEPPPAAPVELPPAWREVEQKVPEKPTFRPPRLKRTTGGGVRSWFEGSETSRTETHAFIAAQQPPAAKPVEAAPAPPPAPQAEPKKEEPKAVAVAPPPPPPRRRIPGRTGPATGAAAPPPPSPGGAPPVTGEGGVQASAAAPEVKDAPPPPNPMFDAYPCVVEPTRAERKVRVTQVVEAYDVAGRTAKDLTIQMRAALPGHGPGRTEANVTPSCTFRQEGHLCTPLCEAVVSLRVRLPRWSEDGPPELVDRWRRFLKRVETHEGSHKYLAIREGNDMLEKIRELARSDCREIQRQVDVQAAVAREQSKTRHRAYDDTCKADPACRIEL